MDGGFNVLSSNLTRDASKKIFVTTGILVFDLDLFIDRQGDFLRHTLAHIPVEASGCINYQDSDVCSRPSRRHSLSATCSRSAR
jgi:hypothetical protein